MGKRPDFDPSTGDGQAVDDFIRSAGIDPAKISAEPEGTAQVLASADDHEFMQRGYRSLRRKGIQAWLRHDEDGAFVPLGGGWAVIVATEDYDRARAAFDGFVARANARSAKRLEV
jgi:hypothetical protein